MERFGKVARKIQNLSHEVALHYMIMALWLGYFVERLYMSPTKNMDEIRQRATEFMRVEEI